MPVGPGRRLILTTLPPIGLGIAHHGWRVSTFAGRDVAPETSAGCEVAVKVAAQPIGPTGDSDAVDHVVPSFERDGPALKFESAVSIVDAQIAHSEIVNDGIDDSVVFLWVRARLSPTLNDVSAGLHSVAVVVDGGPDPEEVG